MVFVTHWDSPPFFASIFSGDRLLKSLPTLAAAAARPLGNKISRSKIPSSAARIIGVSKMGHGHSHEKGKPCPHHQQGGGRRRAVQVQQAICGGMCVACLVMLWKYGGALDAYLDPPKGVVGKQANVRGKRVRGGGAAATASGIESRGFGGGATRRGRRLQAASEAIASASALAP
jgi:hypothetical protein